MSVPEKSDVSSAVRTASGRRGLHRMFPRWVAITAMVGTSVLAIEVGGASAAAGDLDLTFGGDGKVTTAIFSQPNSSATVLAIAVQSDGKIVAVGEAAPPQGTGIAAGADFALARYNANGALDTSFSGDGKLTTDIFGGRDQATAVALQADGKIVVAGVAEINAASFYTRFAVVRYHVNGSLDTTFGTGGKVSTDFFGTTNGANSIGIQPDGKIVVAGAAHDGVGNRFALARYNVDGNLDTSFGIGGKVTTSFFGFDDSVAALALQSDGKIVVVGNAYPGAANNQFAVARYNADGSLDGGFGIGGKVTTDFFGANDLGHAVVLQPSGKIVAAGLAFGAGSGTDQYALARYNLDGSLDNGFGVGGKATIEFSSAWSRRLSAAGQADGKIVTASWGVDSASGFDHFQLARFTADGALDPSFSGDGKVTTTFFGSQNRVYALAVQPDGRILAAGTAFDLASFHTHFALARYDAGGGTVSAPTLSALTVSPTSVSGGSGATGSVTLTAAAPPGGAVVSLTDNSSAVTVPIGVTVQAGATTATFPITTIVVGASVSATVSGSFGGVSRTATMAVTASTIAAPALVAPATGASVAQPVTLDWTDVAGAVDYEIQVDDSSTIAAPFRANPTVSTSQVTVSALPTQQLWWRVRARNSAGVLGPFSATRRFTPQAAPATASLASVSMNPSSVVGGSAATGTVSLTNVAPTGGAIVALSSSSAGAIVPPAVTVPAGAISATFPVSTSPVTAPSPATISAVYAGVTRSAVLAVNPPATTVTLTVTATGRSGERLVSSPAGINVTVGSSQSARFAANTSITLSVANGREAIWSGACSSGGSKAKTCTFIVSANVSVTGNVV